MDLWVRVNPIQLEQVLINLLTNAMQALEEQHQKCVRLSTECKASQVLIHIDDNGQGITQEKIAHLFEPFFTTKKKWLRLRLVDFTADNTKHGR